MGRELIEVKVDDAHVRAVMQRVADGAVNAAPLMLRIAGVMADAVEENFAREGRPKWLGLKPASLLSRAGALTRKGQVSQSRFDKKVRNAKILQDSGRLASSVSSRHDSASAQVGTNLVYAAIHQFGGKTGAHVITAKKKKALAWATGKHPVKKVNHPGSKIPARPFLALTPQDHTRIVFTTSQYLASLAR